MARPTGSRANVGEVRELLNVVEVTPFHILPTGWRNRGARSLDQNISPAGTGVHYLY